MSSELDLSDYRVEVDRVTRSEWTGIVDAFSDSNLYQTWDYEAVHSSERRMSHLLLRQKDEVLGAAQLRIVQFPLLGAGIAYIYFGPMWRRRDHEANLNILQALLGGLREEYAVKRGLLVRIASYVRKGEVPEIRDLLLGAGYRRQELLREYRTFDIDLGLPLDELRAGFHRRWRNHLNKAEKGDLSVVDGTDPDLFSAFEKIYLDMHSRKGFSENVSIVDFGKIQERLPESQKMRVLIASHDGEPCSGLVLSTVGDVAIYLLGATNESGMRRGSSYVLQWRALQWLTDNGFQRYDLGGANPEANPSVYHFKSGLAGKKPEQAATLGVWETSTGIFSPAVVKCGEALRGMMKTWARSR